MTVGPFFMIVLNFCNFCKDLRKDVSKCHGRKRVGLSQIKDFDSLLLITVTTYNQFWMSDVNLDNKKDAETLQCDVAEK